MRALADMEFCTSGHPWFKSVVTTDGLNIDYLSTIPLKVEMVFMNNHKEHHMGYVTAFILVNPINENEQYLITNWHVVTGLNPVDGVTILDTNGCRRPNALRVKFYDKSGIGAWTSRLIPLYLETELFIDKRWIEHIHGYSVDVVAVPLNQVIERSEYYCNGFNKDEENRIMYLTPGENVSIIGYPEGKSFGENYPIWKSGCIASDLCANNTYFLIDATTRPGRSGSPVFAKRPSHFLLDNKTLKFVPRIEFLGVYSGRISDTSHVGKVWHPSVIDDIISIGDK